MPVHTLFRLSLVLLSCLLWSGAAVAEDCPALSTGQKVYVPAYSHIYHGNREARLLLSVTLSLRNVDAQQAITITAIEYFNTEGKLLRSFLERPLTLPPLASHRYVIAQDDEAGGSGANFLVAWQADAPTNPPIFESVMIGSQSQLGISFTSRGQVLHGQAGRKP